VKYGAASAGLGSARLAAMSVLFCNGLLYATWGVNVPNVKDKFGLSEGSLALAMAAVALGGIVTMGRAGRWIGAHGSGKASVLSALLMAMLAAPILLVPTYPLLLLLLCGFGIVTAANDVAANSQGALLEKISGESMIGSLHGSFSIGGLCGALIASNWSVTALTVPSNFYWLALAVGVIAATARPFLKSESSCHRTTEAGPRSAPADISLQALAQRRLRMLGALAFAALVVEGAIYDWAAVYMREVAGAPPAWVGAGYATFAIGMATGRVGGDWVRDRITHQRLVIVSGTLSLVGLSVTLCGVPYWCVAVGFLIAGVGLSNFIPILVSSAGKLSASAGLAAAEGLATTTRIAYLGLLAGPIAIGPLAQAVGLKGSLLLLALALIATCVGWLSLSRASGGIPWELDGSESGQRAIQHVAASPSARC